jgi:hypothetical protein
MCISLAGGLLHLYLVLFILPCFQLMISSRDVLTSRILCYGYYCCTSLLLSLFLLLLLLLLLAIVLLLLLLWDLMTHLSPAVVKTPVVATYREFPDWSASI